LGVVGRDSDGVLRDFRAKIDVRRGCGKFLGGGRSPAAMATPTAAPTRKR